MLLTYHCINSVSIVHQSLHITSYETWAKIFVQCFRMFHKAPLVPFFIVTRYACIVLRTSCETFPAGAGGRILCRPVAPAGGP